MNDIKPLLLFWIKNSAIGFLSLFFLIMGIDLLMGAYALQNPFEFLLSFFASNLIILISAVGCIYVGITIWKQLHQKM